MRAVIGAGYTDRTLSTGEIRDLLTRASREWDLTGRSVLCIIPDSTRTAPLPLMFRLLHEQLAGKAARLDFLVALGTHPPMDEAALNRLLGITPEERATRYAGVGIFNHRWDLPETFVTLGTISAGETEELSQGRLSLDLPVRANRLLLAYDQILICGPVFPHEVAGFSGGNKYLFPGVSGSEVIDFTHWLGALETNYHTIGFKDSPVRAAIEKAATFVPTPALAICMVVTHAGLAGLYIGPVVDAWSQAAGLSGQVHVRYLDKPYRQVLSVLPEMYADIWTGAKGMYKLEPVIEDGGEVIIYAPHIREFSYTHGQVLEKVGYHVRDYFVKQWERFKDYPWGVLAHSTHLRGLGSYENGVERARIRVTLSTGIPRERCEAHNLAYRDPATLQPADFADREEEGILFVPRAGEVLHRLKVTSA